MNTSDRWSDFVQKRNPPVGSRGIVRYARGEELSIKNERKPNRELLRPWQVVATQTEMTEPVAVQNIVDTTVGTKSDFPTYERRAAFHVFIS